MRIKRAELALRLSLLFFYHTPRRAAARNLSCPHPTLHIRLTSPSFRYRSNTFVTMLVKNALVIAALAASAMAEGVASPVEARSIVSPAYPSDIVLSASGVLRLTRRTSTVRA